MRHHLIAATLLSALLATPVLAQPAPPPAPPAAEPAQPPAPPPHPHAARVRFEDANTTHDGKLTLDQATAAGMRMVVKNFGDIDKDHKGFVTKQDLKAWRQEKRAERQARKAARAAAATSPAASGQTAPAAASVTPPNEGQHY